MVLFVGGDAAHNREAVKFLVKDLLPLMPAATRLLIVGRVSAAAPRGHPQIRALGFVENLRMCLAAADVAVNPVSLGGETNVKLAEYIAAGLPTLSTPIGLRGVPHLARRVLCVAREDFAQVLRGNIYEPDRNGLEMWTWDALARRLLGFYRDLLAHKSDGRRSTVD